MHRLFLSAMQLEAASGFRFSENMGKLILTVLLCMVPTFEGRYAVVTAIGMGIPTVPAYLLALFFSTLPMPFILLLIRRVLDWVYTLRWEPVRRYAAWLERKGARGRAKMQRSSERGLQAFLSRHLNAETMELLGLFVFVALPIPGTGVWSGSLVAALFDLPKGRSAVAITLGNAVACLITTLLTTGVLGAIH